MMKKLMLGVMMVVLVGLATQANAAFTMWYTNEAGVAVDQIDILPGATFTVQVWMSTDVSNKGFTAAVGYADCTTMGTSAVVSPGAKLGLAHDNVSTDVTWGSTAVSAYGSQLAYTKTGMRNATGTPTNSVRPYGVALSRGSSDYVLVPGNMLIATITLKSFMTTLGEYRDMVLWNSNAPSETTTSSSYTSILNDGASPYPTASDTLRIMTIPEPVSIVLLALGGLGLLRRRYVN